MPPGRSRRGRQNVFRNRIGHQPCLSDLPGSESLSEARASRSASLAAADIGIAVRSTRTGGVNGAVVALTTTSAASSPMERAASRSSGAASRTLVRQIGESTTKTSLPFEKFASRACAESEDGKQGRNRRSSASSHKARRNGSPAGSASSASSAACGTEGRFGRDLASDIGIQFELSEHRQQYA